MTRNMPSIRECPLKIAADIQEIILLSVKEEESLHGEGSHLKDPKARLPARSEWSCCALSSHMLSTYSLHAYSVLQLATTGQATSALRSEGAGDRFVCL